MKIVKRIFAGVLVLCMMVSLLAGPGSMWKVRAETFGDFEYEQLPDGTVMITKYTGSDAHVTVPKTLDGKAVTQIDDQAFQYRDTLEELVLLDGVARIGANAFSDCTNLLKVTLPDSITGIGEFAFHRCKVLTEVRIPDGVTSIMNGTFAGCFALKEAVIAGSLEKIGDNAFESCTSLTQFHIPDGVTAIGDSAFINCESLMRIVVPDGVTSIGEGAFYKCKSLEEFSIPDGVHDIKPLTFGNCEKLARVSLTESVTTIENSAFTLCKSLKDVYYSGTEEKWNEITIDKVSNQYLANATIHFSDGPTLNGPEGFEYKILQDDTIEITKCTSSDEVIIIPETIEGRPVVTLGFGAFLNNRDWREIHIPASVTKVDDTNFMDCKLEGIYVDESNANYLSENGVLFHKDQTKLIKYPQGREGDYQIPCGTEIIANYAFEEAGGLTGVTIPSGVTTLGHHAFNKCSQLTEIRLPTSVVSIGRSAFEHCDRLAEMEIPSGIKSIPSNCFMNAISLTKVTIPSSVTAIENAAFYQCDSFTDVYYDGVLDQWENIQIGTGGIAGIDSSINTNAPLVNAVIHFSDGTTLNGSKEEFSYRELDNGTVEITKYNGSNPIVAVPEQLGQKKVSGIGNKAFYQKEEVTEVSIPDGVTRILPSAFQECKNLTKISIPESVTTIAEDAFQNCTNLQDIYYSGTKTQWDKVDISKKGNEALLSAEVHWKEEPPQDGKEEIILPVTVDAKQELERLKSGDSFFLEPDFMHYLSAEQIDVLESYLYTWLAEVNYTYQYSGADGVKERIRKKSGIDPQGDFRSGKEQAITHVVAETKYGTRTFEITLDLGVPDSSGNLYPTYGTMRYEVLEKGSLPTDLPLSGQIGRSTYTDLGPLADSVKKTSEDSLHHTFQWQSLNEEMTAGILVDKTVTEIIGNKKGSFSDAAFTIYVESLLTYSKKVTIACPVDVFVYSMDGKGAGSIVDHQPNEENPNVRLDVNGDTKTVYLAGNDYYLNLRGTDTGTMKYEVEEIANEEVRRNVQFLELQLKKDMQYEGYVFRPLNIDRDLYALRTVDGSSKEVIYADTDSYQATFKRVEQMSLSQQSSSLNEKSSVQLHASLLPLDASNPNLNWTTDQESVISVDSNGLVTAVGAGRATVTVSTKDGSFLKQFCVFDVADPNSPGDDFNQQPCDGSSGSGTDDGPGNFGGGSGNMPGDSDGGSGNAPGGSGSGTGNTPGNSGSGSSNGSSGNFGGSSGGAGGSSSFSGQTAQPVVVKLHYVIQFDTNGGTNLSRRTMTLLDGDSPGIMPKVQRKDYLFRGWYTQKEGGKQVAGDKPLEEAATLYARWVRASAPVKTASLKLVSKKKGQAQVSFQKVTGAAGYQAEYAADKTFASAKKKNIGANTKTKTLTGLKAGKKYYVRVRAYVLDSMGNKIYGIYSTVKSIRIHS